MSDPASARPGDRLRPLVTIAIVLAVVVGVYFAAKTLPFDALGDIRERPLR